MFCNPQHGRNIVILKGSKGHGPCEDKIRGFKKGLASPACAQSSHAIKWYFHAGYTRAKAKSVMGKVFVRDATVSAVFACNDDMALGTIDAARDLGDETKLNSLVVLGYNNDTISQTFLKGQLEQLEDTQGAIPRTFRGVVSTFSGVPLDVYTVRPTMYATVEQMDGFIAQARKLIHEQVSSAGTTSGQVEEWRKEWHVQAQTANIFVQTPIAPEFAENCKHGLPEGCPPKLAAAIRAMPGAAHIMFAPLLSIAVLVFVVFSLTFMPTLVYSLHIAMPFDKKYLNLAMFSDAHTPGVIAFDILWCACSNALACYAVFCELVPSAVSATAPLGAFTS